MEMKWFEQKWNTSKANLIKEIAQLQRENDRVEKSRSRIFEDFQEEREKRMILELEVERLNKLLEE